MIDATEAERLARNTIRELAGTAENDFSLQPEKTVEHGDGWIFFYNSLQFIQTGDPIYMLAGMAQYSYQNQGNRQYFPLILLGKILY